MLKKLWKLTVLAMQVMLVLSACGGTVGSGSNAQSESQRLLAGPLSVEIPNEWTVLGSTDTDLIHEPWVAGALDSPDTMTKQIRLTANSNVAPNADATNSTMLLGNALAQEGTVSPRGTESYDVDGADEAVVSYFEFEDPDGDVWDGLFLSAGNRETGNVSTMELMSMRDGGLSQDEVKAIMDTAVYKKDQEAGAGDEASAQE